MNNLTEGDMVIHYNPDEATSGMSGYISRIYDAEYEGYQGLSLELANWGREYTSMACVFPIFFEDGTPVTDDELYRRWQENMEGEE